MVDIVDMVDDMDLSTRSTASPSMHQHHGPGDEFGDDVVAVGGGLRYIGAVYYWPAAR